MNAPPLPPAVAAPPTPATNLCDRQHRLDPPKTFTGRCLLWLQDRLEAAVARVSVHGDPPIYETATFTWVAEVEGDWRKIRAELDQVMKFRDQMPSFQDILKEVSPIQSDNQWKTFSSRASAWTARRMRAAARRPCACSEKFPD